MKKYNAAVFIGRFQPLHQSHIDIINKASEIAEKVIILVGSANKPRTIKNPWTYDEREAMIRFSVSSGKVEVFPLEDRTYNHEQWLANVQQLVASATSAEDRVCLIGHYKDDTSFYLSNFPQYEVVDVGNINDLNSTGIRKAYFESGIIDSRLPNSIQNFLNIFKGTQYFEDVKKEWNFYEGYKKAWSQSPFPPIFVTVDAVVVQSGHILLIERGDIPGKGLMALPGGFIESKETVFESCVRELREETGLKVPTPVLKGSLIKSKVFDSPERSLRGRCITHAFLFRLKDEKELPRVKGDTDASKAEWVPLAEVYQMQDKLFEDHYSIIYNLISST